MPTDPADTLQAASAPLVSLPMYTQRPVALAAFWQGLRAHLEQAGLPDLPESLAQDPDLHAQWTSPALLMSQTCGYPLTYALRGAVRYVGTPTYSAPGFEQAHYRSLVVVRSDDEAQSLADLRGRRAAYNSTDSQSGYNAFRAAVAPLARDGRFFAETIASGSHVASLRAVRQGDADAACIDCVSFALIGRADPAATAAVRVLAMTPAAPGLPIVTALSTSDADVSRLRSGWKAALADPALADARADLMLAGFEVLDPAVYEAIPRMEAEAKARGYPRLA
jgi:ABC-type phosphate/phosphonate transport system substrate-binding protein